jgi:lipoprotein-anchoring transpeptidase ErfK/SrfK
MPYMQRLTDYGIALHGGRVPGYPASHGCIRLPHAMARRLYNMTRPGTRVTVTSARIRSAEQAQRLVS